MGRRCRIALAAVIAAAFAMPAAHAAVPPLRWVKVSPVSKEQVAIAVSGDGSIVVTTGTSGGSCERPAATVARSTSTGDRWWSRTGPSEGGCSADLAIGGGRAFVTGETTGEDDTDAWTAAYALASGRRLWSARFAGAVGEDTAGVDLAVTSDGRVVYVLLRGRMGTSPQRMVVLKYQASTGRLLWSRVQDAPGGAVPAALTIPSGTSSVFVTGTSAQEPKGQGDFLTFGYAADGTRLWTRRYAGPGDGTYDGDRATAITVSPHGRRIYVTGESVSPNPERISDAVTVAYRRGDGATVWRRRDHGPYAGCNVRPSAIEASPDGERVYIVGVDAYQCNSFQTFAFASGDGSLRWSERDLGAGWYDARGTASLALGPGGATLFVIEPNQECYDYGDCVGYAYQVVARSAASGRQRWLRLWGRSRGSWPTAAVAAPGGLYVTGGSHEGAATLAFDLTSG
jgi:hypothetical protein